MLFLSFVVCSFRIDWASREVVGQVLEDMPPDLTSGEESLYSALFRADTLEALSAASKVDPWLSAHLADIMGPLALVEGENDAECVAIFVNHFSRYKPWITSTGYQHETTMS